MNRSGRVGIIVVLVVSLLLAGVTRDWARSLRAGGAGSAAVAADAGSQSLANMNSFALALLLGGLRGPLVMFLWTQSENLKNERNLEDFDTYVEWIRLLQPEFDTVHIFQVWNKAYNISVQMASWANKYTTVLDAIDYAQRVLAQRPNNVNMIYQIGSIYFDKLGNASEKEYYRRRVREESKQHQAKQQLRQDDPGWRRLELDPVLDRQGNLLPEMIKPRHGRPATLADGAEWNNGAELQYLEPYQPFPYGVSTFGFAYNYHKQAQVLQDVMKVQHANLSDVVVDSRPALSLKGWSEDEWELGRRLEMRAFNAPVPAERREFEVATARTALDAPASDRALLEEAVYSYDRAARLSRDSIGEYERHLRNHSLNLITYQNHMDSIRAQELLLLADRDYLRAMLLGATGDASQRKALLSGAAENYRNSAIANLRIALKYYAPEEPEAQVLPPGITRGDADKLTPEQVMQSYGRMRRYIGTLEHDPDAEDRGEYELFAARAQARAELIDAATKQ